MTAPSPPGHAGHAITTAPRRSVQQGLASLSPSSAFGLGLATLAMSMLALIPLAAILVKAAGGGWSGFWASITDPLAWSALKLTVELSALVTLVNAVMGTLVAWVLVRDEFVGQRALDVIIDLPFALPTIVAGLVLVLLYGHASPLGIDLAQKTPGVFLALLFVTLPFVVRAVQPVLLELDGEVEDAAASLGASQPTIFRRIILPNIWPAISAGAALSFARALGEYGSTVLISGNLAGKTQVASVQILGQIENDNTAGAAAVATVLLATALAVIFSLDVFQRWTSHRG